MITIIDVERRGRMVRTSDSQPEGRVFESRRRHGVVSVSRIPYNPQLGLAIISRIACGIPNLIKKTNYKKTITDINEY
jgi:hypothetical protein